MNLLDAFRVWRRRWILTGLLLVLAVAGTAGAAMKLPRTYQAVSTVVLLPSVSASQPNGGNPYLSFTGSLPLTADVIAYQMMAPSSVQALAARGYGATYTVASATNTTGPVLQTTVTGSNKNAVEHTLSGVTAEIGTQLSDLQRGITSRNQISVVTLSVGVPALSVSKTARPLVLVLALGLILALAIPLIVDGQATRRRNRIQAPRSRAGSAEARSPAHRAAADSGSASAHSTQAPTEEFSQASRSRGPR